MPANFNHIQQLADQDVDSLKESEKSYGDSWRSRGFGVLLIVGV